MSIKILICDDDKLIRESLKILLPMKGDIKVVAEAENGKDAIRVCMDNEVDVALIDIRMPVLNGVEAIRKIVEKTHTKCLVLTTFDEEEYVKEALECGAKGYILKNNSPDQIVNSIVSVYNNTIVMNEVILKKLQDKKSTPKISRYEFTDREIDIIEAMAEGLNNKQIGERLFLTEGTVRNYITGILNKTGIENRTAIAVSYLKGNL